MGLRPGEFHRRLTEKGAHRDTANNAFLSSPAMRQPPEVYAFAARLLAGMLAALWLASMPALAEGTEEDGGPQFRALFGKPTGQCYQRVYDAAHLASHPRQSVASIRIERVLTFSKGKESWDAAPNTVMVSVRFRDRPKRRYSGGANCRTEDDGKLACHSDSCDGGSFSVEARGEDILLRINPESGHFTLLGCGEDEHRGVSTERDDRVFLMGPVKDGRCSTRFLVTD